MGISWSSRRALRRIRGTMLRGFTRLTNYGASRTMHGQGPHNVESSTLYGTVSQRDELGQTSVLSAPPPLAMHWADRATGRVLARTKMFDAGFGDVSALERMRDDHELFGAAPDVPLEAALAHAVSLPQVPGLRPRATEGIALRELSWHSEAVDPRFEAPVRRARALLLVGGRSPANTTTLDPSTPLCIAMAASGERRCSRRWCARGSTRSCWRTPSTVRGVGLDSARRGCPRSTSSST